MPFSTSGMVFSEQLLITAITVSVAFFFVLYAYLARKINTSAFIGTFTLGVVILASLGLRFGYIGLLALLAFFLFGNLVTRYKYNAKALLGVAEGNKGMRGIPNVLGNGFAPLVFAVLYAVSVSRWSYPTLFLLGFSGAVATACADTFSTEIGEAEGNPRLITTFKKVPVGTSGGVSLPGFGAALLGSALISLVCLLFVLSGEEPRILTIFFLVCLLSGFFGSIADSIFGATIEDKPIYKKRLQTFLQAKSLTKNALPASQFRLNKHHVNILSTLSGGLFAMVLGSFLGVRI
ncbi:MAG: DUF92 domain-containing protein [Methanophagales archaeon ANME-1-THS]|nr:MAG: DUF92 domain-containing protein [Methanophagales archaeon ANME-1-THS]